MKIFDKKHIKNVALVGSSKSGKTTLSETMLFEAGLINRRGSVEDANTVSDYHEIEHQRGNTIFASTLHTEWRNYKINLIDTPGLDDFIGEVISSVRVADTSVMLINAQHGVEVGTELVWRCVDHFNKPNIFAVNQCDHPKTDFDETLESLKNYFGSAVTQMQYPLECGENFDSIIDLLKMVMYKFPSDGGKPQKLPIPEEEKSKADYLHNELIEKAAENDENLMELYFKKGNLDEDELREGLKIGMLNHQVFPVFCMSAKKNMGSGRMMGFIDNVAPCASELEPEHTLEGKDVNFDEKEPTSLFVFKTYIEPNLGKISYFKVTSGQVNIGDEFVNSQTDNVERFSQLFVIDGKTRVPVDRLEVGDIGATIKLKTTVTNHTLHSKDFNVTIDPIKYPSFRVTKAVRATNKHDEDRLGEVIAKVHLDDPTITTEYSSELKQLLIHAQGELHLEIVKWQLSHIYGLDIEYLKPRISYRETITSGADATYRHKKQSGGSGQFGEVTLRVDNYYEDMLEPTGYNIRGKEEVSLPWGGKLMFYNCIVGGVIDSRFIPAIKKGIIDEMSAGPITGSCARDVRVMVYDGKMHSVDSNDISFQIAGKMAFREAFKESSPQILEPVQKVEVIVPEELMGDVMTELQSRRSMIEGIEAKSNSQLITAKTPLREMDGFSNSLRSLTQGRATFTSEFSGYSIVPSNVQKQIAQEAL